MFEGVLDMLSGRYPSDEFAELRPRITWDRVHGTLDRRAKARSASRSPTPARFPTAGCTASSSPAPIDRPASASSTRRWSSRPQVGETFTLGASTWRIEEITHDRVLVSPAPGEPGKMPFWHGDRAGRPVELGYAIGKLVRELRGMPRAAAVERLVAQHDLDAPPRRTCSATSTIRPRRGRSLTTARIVIERCLDELGDWRVCLLSPLGSRIHAPWAMAVTAHIRNRTGHRRRSHVGRRRLRRPVS